MLSRECKQDEGVSFIERSESLKLSIIKYNIYNLISKIQLNNYFNMLKILQTEFFEQMRRKIYKKIN